MKSDKEVNEQFDEESQTQEGRAKKGTSNAKNYSFWYTGVELRKIFVALLEEEKGTFCTTYFTTLLLIDLIATMPMLVVEIFYRHHGDMKFQFGRTIIQMKPIHVCLILGLHVSPIANEFLFVDLENITNFKIRRFPKKKNTYGLKEIGGALKQAKLERYHGFVSFYLLRNHIKAPTVGAAPAMEPPTVDAPAVGVPAIYSSSSTTEIRAVVVRSETVLYYLEIFYSLGCTSSLLLRKLQSTNEKKKQVTPGEGLEVVKDLMVNNDVEVGMEVNLEAISPEYGGGLLEWKKSDKKDDEDEKDDDDEIDVEEKVKSVEEEQPQVVKKKEVQENGDEKVDDVEKDGDEKAKSEEEQPQVAKEDNLEQLTIMTKKSIKEVEQSKDEEDVDKTKESKKEVERSKDKVIDVYIKALIQYFDT
ncbi:hypothetical protein GIB67_000261 [Kingdonia uniflora]|uniref:Uncharacterized protein n=1 Tax=Kingdonia uniflora TaxID=39325 RepID=A0A7J7LC63_9MAGN|nr:hypothetical protein GIB67_000261 [Kingdonia uniflora]